MARWTIYTHLRQEQQERWKELACEGKLRHATIEAAELARIALEQGGKQGLNVYLCPWCFAYHVGHANGKRARAS